MSPQPQSLVSRCERGERRVDAVEFEDFAKLVIDRSRPRRTSDPYNPMAVMGSG